MPDLFVRGAGMRTLASEIAARAGDLATWSLPAAECGDATADEAVAACARLLSVRMQTTGAELLARARSVHRSGAAYARVDTVLADTVPSDTVPSDTTRPRSSGVRAE